MKWKMRFFLAGVGAVLGGLGLPAAEAQGQTTYWGQVGKLEAEFRLNWGAGGEVTGSYFYSSRPGVVYGLSGVNPREGVLVLDEYTGGVRTARCDLRKAVGAASVTWEGTMQNTDGRSFRMWFSRERAVAPGAAAVAPGAPAGAALGGGGAVEQVYAGQVGKLAAEFLLRWEDGGKVFGSYHYPSRKGVHYQLAGENRRSGELYLEEYTGGKLTARCGLVKRMTEDKVYWLGVMLNEDGRKFEMYFSRDRTRAAPDGGGAEAPRKVVTVAVQKLTEWAEPPKRRAEEHEASPAYVDGSQFIEAVVRTSRYDGATLEVAFEVLETDWEGLDYLVPAEKEAMLRVVYPGGADPFRKGERCQITFGPDGRILHIYLNDIAVTHWRKRADGRVEVRGVPWSEKLAGAEGDYEIPHLSEEELAKVELREVLPDKLALTAESPVGMHWRSMIFFEHIGLIVHVESAGPGELSMERIPLGIEEPLEAPWNSVKEKSGEEAIPRTQRTVDAG